jgi:predicted nucleotidyltransferase
MVKIKKNRKAEAGGNIKYFNFLRNWLHQAFTYMDKGEKALKLLLILVETYLLLTLISSFTNFNTLSVIIVSFLIIHTFNWITNGLFWALTIFAIPSLKNPGEDLTLIYLNEMTERLKVSKSIEGLVIFGSVSRGKWHDRSDIDIRLVRSSGLSSLLVSFVLTVRERFIAFLSKQPMDLFLADDIVFLKKMRKDEKPIFLIKRGHSLDKEYPDSDETVLKTLKIKNKNHEVS